MNPAVKKALDALVDVAVEVGPELIQPLIDALVAGNPEQAARAARIVAETAAAKRAIREARGKAP